MFLTRRISPESLLRRVASGRHPLILGLPGDTSEGLPGMIPVGDDPLLFHAAADQVEKNLGHPLPMGKPVVLACLFGRKSEEAVARFYECNRRRPYRLFSLEGGIMAYERLLNATHAPVDQLSSYHREMTLVNTNGERFTHLAEEVLAHQPDYRARMATLLHSFRNSESHFLR